MGIVYNNAWTNLANVIRWTGSFSADLGSSSGYDYFDDTSVVGHYMMFALGGMRAHRNLRLNVAVPFTATSVTFVWEYSVDAWNWSALPNVTNADAMTKVGTQDVTWDNPVTYGVSQPTGRAQGTYVRCRISALVGLTEGGAQGNTRIQGGLNRLEVTGYSSTTPCTFADLYNASVAGGWGVVSKSGETLYALSAALYIGGSTAGYFGDSGKGVYFGGGYWPYFYANGYCVFGSYDATLDRSYNGCSITFGGQYVRAYIAAAYAAGISWNDCTIYLNGMIDNNAIGASTFRDCTFYIPWGSWPCQGYNYRCYWSAGTNVRSYGSYYIDCFLSAPDMETNGGPITLSGATVKGGFKYRPYRSTDYCVVLNQTYSDGNKTCVFDNRSTGTVYVYGKVTLTFKCQDAAGNALNAVTVAIRDAAGATVYSATVNSGDTTSLTIDRWEQPAGTNSNKQPVAQGPFTITFSKSGYQTHTGVYTITNATTFTDVLHPQVSLLMPLGEAVYKNLQPANGQNSKMWVKL